MPAPVIRIGELQRANASAPRTGHWSLLELTVGSCRFPLGILLVDSATGALATRLRSSGDIRRVLEAENLELEEQEVDILDCLEQDLHEKAREDTGSALLDSLEDTLSHFLLIGDRTSVAWTGGAQRAADRLFDEHVDPEVRPFETHLPLYGLRIAATKFGESMAAGEDAGEEEAWIRVPAGFRKLAPGMFVAHVVGRSMEPLIPDGSLCVFRQNVTGSRQGRHVLIEKFSESDFASRYTVKRYTSRKKNASEGSDGSGWEHSKIRLEPLNPEFEAFELGPDEFRVVAEFVEVLDSPSQ